MDFKRRIRSSIAFLKPSKLVNFGTKVNELKKVVLVIESNGYDLF